MELKIQEKVYEADKNNALSTQLFDYKKVILDNDHRGYREAKRFFDLVLSLIGLMVLMPLMVIVAIVIKCTSPGPIIYKQTRLGFRGRPFAIYKFRTMVDDAEKYTGPVLASKDDIRYTAIGSFLRATRLDELPQLVNVIKGDMSLVGPRPERPELYDVYLKTVPNFTERLMVKPGLTGLAQVKGDYDIAPEEKLQYDKEYIEKCSLAFDLLILIKTVGVVFSRKGQ